MRGGGGGGAGVDAGTARTVPEDDLGMVAMQLQNFKIEALMIVGGFEAFLSVAQLIAHRDQYPQFCIPIMLLPATISNNVPGTEISLGTDTSLNIIVESCDEIKQSASSTTRRVFVIEVMGGRCGYLATMAALAGAATRAYIPEKGITFSDLAEDIVVCGAWGCTCPRAREADGPLGRERGRRARCARPANETQVCAGPQRWSHHLACREQLQHVHDRIHRVAAGRRRHCERPL